jgi:hypothetical protein
MLRKIQEREERAGAVAIPKSTDPEREGRPAECFNCRDRGFVFEHHRDDHGYQYAERWACPECERGVRFEIMQQDRREEERKAREEAERRYRNRKKRGREPRGMGDIG